MIDIRRLLRCDLNLLLCLHVLLEEQSVSRTAYRLNLSQSAVSKNLAKLREWLDDPLFFRLSKGLTPSNRANELKPIILQILELTEKLAKPKIFDPNSSPRCFKLGLIDSIYPLLLPKFIGEIFNYGPHLTINTTHWNNSSFDKLRTGELDFGISGKELDSADMDRIIKIPRDIASRELYRERLCCLVQKDHPVLSQKWDLNTYLNAQHIQVRCGVDYNDRWLLDFKLSEQGLTRDIATCVSDFNSAASLTTYTDLVLTSPYQFATQISKQLDLVILPLPFNIPEMTYTLFWSRHYENKPCNQWLNEIIVSRCTNGD